MAKDDISNRTNSSMPVKSEGTPGAPSVIALRVAPGKACRKAPRKTPRGQATELLEFLELLERLIQHSNPTT